MKILVLTKNNPVEILHTVERIYSSVSNGNMKHMTCISPQVVALMVEEAKDYPYLEVFFSALRTFENQKEDISTKCNNLIVVGTVPISTRYWYDAVVGLDNEEIEDYPAKSIPNNIDNISLMELKHADVTFNNFETLRIFLKKAIQEKK